MTDAPPAYLQADGEVTHLILNSPPRNELGQELGARLTRIVSEDLPRLDVAGLVLRGAGRHFSSGAEISSLKDFLRNRNDKEVHREVASYARLGETIAALPYPVVAAVSGSCLGSALELALLCHYRVAARNAVFAAPEVEFGIMPGAGGTVRLPRLVGRAKALELILTGRTVGAAEALEIGLVDAVVHRKDLLDTARRAIDRVRPRYNLLK